MTEILSLFFAFMAIGGAFAVVGILVAALLVRLGGPGHSALSNLAAEIRPYAMVFAFVAAATAMAGSLYYSEGAGFDPCHKCWLQRYCMYPAALLLGAYLLTKRRLLALAAWLLSAVGICISIWHRLEQQFPDKVGGSCDPFNPCSGRYVNEFDFVTIPTMAAVAFALVLVLIPLAFNPFASLKSTSNSTPVEETP